MNIIWWCVFSKFKVYEHLLSMKLPLPTFPNSYGKVNTSCTSLWLLSHQNAQLFVTPWTAACQDSLVLQDLPEFAQIDVHWVSDACYPTISSSAVLLSLCLQSFPAWRSFPASTSFSSVQLLSHIQLFVTPWIAARQASLSITNSQSSPKLMCIGLVMPSSHLILCRPLLLSPIPPTVRVFSSESTLHTRWPRYWSFSISIIPSKEIPGLISFRMDWLDLKLLSYGEKTPVLYYSPRQE